MAYICARRHFPIRSKKDLDSKWRELRPRDVGVSCHTRAEVARAAQEGAISRFSDQSSKRRKAPTRPTGLEALHEACQEKIPVLALGGVTLENAEACIQAGAAGIAAIRLFQENEIGEVVARCGS